MNNSHNPENRLHALDAVRGFALLLGVAFHAALSFLGGPPGTWFAADNSSNALLGDAAFVTHIFRMSLFFFIAGYFGRLLYLKLGARSFWANRATRILIPLVAGWVVLSPIISFLWITGLTKAFGGKLPPTPAMPADFFPLGHLWFLYQLLIIYVVVITARSLVARLDPAQRLRGLVDKAVSGSIRTMAGTFTLGLPVAAALMSLSFWVYWMGIPTPDMTLVPQVPASVGFGTAFAFGWLVHRSTGALAAITQRWISNLGVAIVATGWLLHSMHAEPFAQPGLTKTVYALVFGVALWGWVLGLTGAALRFLSNYSATRRYLADASYWVYLAHLPVVVALQIWVSQWPLHWSVKYPFILVVSFAVLFASYHFLIRPTFIGQLLNGRKYRRADGRKPLPPSSSPSPAAPPPANTANGSPVAQLRGITKRFGAVTALHSIDLEVRPGELLAVLGPNGAGKSTAISLWLGLIEPDAGTVTLLGGEPQDIARRRGLGVMMQDVEMPKELRPRELVALASSYYENPLDVEETLKRAGIMQFADRAYGKLSGGQKRQAQFAVAICGRPKVLFLDEPTVGLDIQARQAMWKSIRALLADGCSIVLTTHYLEEAETLADRVAVVAKGRVIASGSVDDMRALVVLRQISCESSLSVDEVRGWPGVVEVTRDASKLNITTTDAEGVVRRLLASDAKLARLEVRQAGLNEAFNELTREAA
ncbi:MAG TPA: acyltransferase family protein [Steroidobacteraceae bacterium]|jgi:ABC-type multidrug transport system ATPase subunit/peptidoglycan/LPS O-acetylase OafA/YrhL|nr:acyltransferase family protein [Steroidobacteraceae bacterium]